MPGTIGNASSELKLEKKRELELADLKKKNETSLSDFAMGLAYDRIDKIKERQLKDEDDLSKKRKKNIDEEEDEKDKRARERNNRLIGVINTTTSALTSAIDKTLDKYLENVQAISAHLQGSTTSLTNITNNLQSTLSTTNLVRQEKVYENLSNLVKAGITYNVEQRAFLQTLAQDIDLVFNTSSGSLAQLIRLQGTDMSANRLAITYSLQEFLNKNYQTSEYIRESFQNISEAIFAAQSTMSAASGMQFESTVQTWLGSMYSAGMNRSTVESLASAINDLGSGNISNLGNGISNLLLMGAARAGLDYGALLNNGLTSDSTDRLLAGLTSYLAEMNANTTSNVVRSQLGQLFGVNITDILAANRVGTPQGGVSSDIYSTLFQDYGSFITFGTGFRNAMENLMWSVGTNMATDRWQLMSYEITKMIANSGLGNLLFDLGDKDALNSKLLRMGGIAVNNLQLLPILGSILGINGSGFGSGTFMDVINSLSAGTRGIAGLFNTLGTANDLGSTIRISGAGVSGGMYIGGQGSTGDLLSGSMSSLNELTSSVVTVEGEKVTIEENVQTITDTTSAILDLLTEKLESIDDNVLAISTTNSLASAAVTGWQAINRGASF